MQSHQISVEEANQLSQQNQSLKKKKSKTSSKALLCSGKPYDSPHKTYATANREDCLEQSFMDLEKQCFEEGIRKKDRMFRKSSLQNIPSHKDVFEHSAQSQPILSLRNDRPASCQELTLVKSSLDGEGSEKMIAEGNEKIEKEDKEQQILLFSEAEIKDLKRDLEIKSRGKICKTQQVDAKTQKIIGYHFYCKCEPDCPFHCFLALTQVANLKGQHLFRLKTQCQEHLQECYEDEQEIRFLKLTKLIDSMEQGIRGKLEANGELKPKDILSWMAGELGYSDHRFIYQGLTCKNYHKAAKKYFDNMIYKIKNPNNQ